MQFTITVLPGDGIGPDVVDEAVKVLEAAGRRFGHQFELRYGIVGGRAIDETGTPLPDETLELCRSADAILFGGTDPGRFVPTYMIFSANVRPDVFLLTQNALADNTFMNVTRDLYGDQIWIPAMQDSAKAFQIYVSEVQSGKRQAHADLKIENGRVQVSGALGVMGAIVSLPVAVPMFLLARIGEVIDNPSDQHFSTQVLPRRYWARVQGFRVCGFQMLSFVGSLLGGVLILDYGYGVTFGLACVSRIASGLIMAAYFGLGRRPALEG